MATRYLGAAVRRIEDLRLLNGAGCYLDDLALPAGLEAVFVRSTIAHGLIRAVDASAARALSGVHAVYLAEDLGPAASRPMPVAAPHALLIQPPHAGAVGNGRGLLCRPADRAGRRRQPLHCRG